jgi:peptide/nickel transport system substrate-binding protein
VPQSGNRRALLERGDADVSFDLPSKDFNELAASKKLTVVGTPVENALQYIAFNVNKPPFDDLRIRQAIACALPYQAIMDSVMFGRALPMFGANKPVDATWPQPHPYATDLDRAKALMAASTMPNGFETTLSFDLGLAGVNEPICVLVQESLARIGIKLTINKIPPTGARTAEEAAVLTNLRRLAQLPRLLLLLGLSRPGRVFNTMSHKNPKIWIDIACFAPDTATYEAAVKSSSAVLRRCCASMFQPTSTSRCRRTSPATATGSIASSTTASWRRRRGAGGRGRRRRCWR